MSSHELYAPAKLNLFLHVTGRRDDGYHLLQSIFTLIDVGDRITLDVRQDGIIRRINTIEAISPEIDLTLRAAAALKNRTGCPLGVDIELKKVIPMGAGLGGGSADAATMLLALNRLWHLNLPNATLREIGLGLGADVPFFVFGKTAFAEGIGETLAEIPLPVWWYVVLTPKVHVPTPFVFSQTDLTRSTPHVKMLDFSAGVLVDALLRTSNDLQAVVLKAFPAVAASLAALSAVSKKSIFGARMTGSGAGVFAAFETEQGALEAYQQLPPELTGFVVRGLEKHPLL